jgi:hypothetical protein
MRRWQKIAYKILAPILLIQGIIMLFDGEIIGVANIISGCIAIVMYEFQEKL